MSKLTVIIPCKNERQQIRGCIDAVTSLAHEVLVADSGSTDGTPGIARELGCRVIEREYVTSGNFKNWAIPQATHDWVLIVDADERVTAALRGEIGRLLKSGPRQDGYWIGRNNYFLACPVRHGSWGKDEVLRLFHRDKGRYAGPSDHGEVQISSGKVGRLRGRLEHYTYASYTQCLRKYERYTALQARQWHQEGRSTNAARLLLHVPCRFLRDYVLKGGFLDGAVGIQVAWLGAFYSFLKQGQLWEAQRSAARPGQSQPDGAAASGPAEHGHDGPLLRHSTRFREG